MAFNPSTLTVGAKVGVLDNKGGKHRGAVKKILKREQQAVVTLENGRDVTVGFDKLRGLQGRPAAGAAPAPVAAPKAAPAKTAAPAAKPAAAPAPARNASKQKASYSDIVERVRDRHSQIAEMMNALADDIMELAAFDPGEAAPEPAKRGGRAAAAPMSDDSEPTF